VVVGADVAAELELNPTFLVLENEAPGTSLALTRPAFGIKTKARTADRDASIVMS